MSAAATESQVAAKKQINFGHSPAVLAIENKIKAQFTDLALFGLPCATLNGN